MDFLYFTDPMCSWCYGFGPSMRALVEAYGDRITLRVIAGGLRPGETRAMRPNVATEILRHWDAVHEATGLPFDTTFFAKHPDFVYDTLPACRAVATVNILDQAKALDFQEELQRRFYAAGEDPTASSTFEAAAQAVGLDPRRFLSVYGEEATELATRAGFAEFLECGGGMGFPTLVLALNGKNKIVTIGHQTLDHLVSVVENILQKEADARRRLN